MSAALCPRCGRPEHPMFGARLTALSRKAKVAVCSSCGTDEAMRARRGQDPWPSHPALLPEWRTVEISGERN